MAHDPSKRERTLPEDALAGDDRDLLKSIFGEEGMAELDGVVEENEDSGLDVFIP